MYSFCDVETYEALTGTVVPASDTGQVQSLLDLHSDIAGLYMGEPCATKAELSYPEVLAGVVAYRTYRLQTVPAGVQSESVGSSSISYIPTQANQTALTPSEQWILDALCGKNTNGRGISSVSFAGRVTSGIEVV